VDEEDDVDDTDDVEVAEVDDDDEDENMNDEVEGEVEEREDDVRITRVFNPLTFVTLKISSILLGNSFRR